MTIQKIILLLNKNVFFILPQETTFLTANSQATAESASAKLKRDRTNSGNNTDKTSQKATPQPQNKEISRGGKRKPESFPQRDWRSALWGKLML